MKTKSRFTPRMQMRIRRDFMEIEKITQVLQKRGIQLTAFQYGERCHGGVQGLSWDADVIEVFLGKYLNNGEVEVVNGVTAAFNYFFKSVGAKWKKEYLSYRYDDIITVMSVIDCWAPTILKHMFQNGYVSKCPTCSKYVHDVDMYDANGNCYDCHKKEQKQ